MKIMERFPLFEGQLPDDEQETTEQAEQEDRLYRVTA